MDLQLNEEAESAFPAPGLRDDTRPEPQEKKKVEAYIFFFFFKL